MTIIKTKVVIALIASVGFFLLSGHNSYKHTTIAICVTPNPYIDPDGTGIVTTECPAPSMIECCIRNGAVYFKRIGAI